jgi:hypothetical protein
MVYNAIQHPPPPHNHTLSVYTVHLVLGRGGEGQREGRGATVEGRGATVHKYSSDVHRATAHKLGRKYQPCVNVSPVYKIC